MNADHAAVEAPDHAAVAVRVAAEQRATSDGDAHVELRWWPEAGCHLTMMHQRIEGTLADLRALSAIFYAAATLPRQPWYEQFRGGLAEPLDIEVPGVLRACRSISTFDLGLPTPRAYPTSCVEVAIDDATRVVALNEIDDAPAPPEPAVPVVLRPPSGDVFHHDGTMLHWHHLIATPGVGLGPRWFDHGLLRTLRTLGLVGAERQVMKSEGEGLRRFVRDTDLATFCAEHAITIQ